MNRGSISTRARTEAPCSRCFNEAPIHESGKCEGALQPLLDAYRFNEAPIHESGKSGLAVQQGQPGGQASMRPRFMNRGSEREGQRSGPGGARFNEAPIHESGKWPQGRRRDQGGAGLQ